MNTIERIILWCVIVVLLVFNIYTIERLHNINNVLTAFASIQIKYDSAIAGFLLAHDKPAVSVQSNPESPGPDTATTTDIIKIKKGLRGIHKHFKYKTKLNRHHKTIKRNHNKTVYVMIDSLPLGMAKIIIENIRLRLELNEFKEKDKTQSLPRQSPPQE